MTEHPQIDFRDSLAGRHAYVKGSGLAVWEVSMVARDYDGDVPAIAAHLQWPLARVQAALNYASDYPGEIEAALADNDVVSFDALHRLLPQAQRFDVSDETTHGRASL